MDGKLAMIFGVTMVVALGLGCTTAPDATTEPSPPGDTVGSDGPPDGSRFVCHLSCSGKEAEAYGPTEEEARANARALVDTICNPDDGQHFIFCDPLE